MKSKSKFLLAILFMIGVSVFFGNLTVPKRRYHQHLEDDKGVTIVSGKQEAFSSHLPVIDIVTDGAVPDPYVDMTAAVKERSNETVAASVKYYDHETTENALTDTPVVEENAVFRIRGRSSREYDKKGYLLKFKEDNLIDNKKVSLSGMTADSEWVLHGPFLDKTLIRNYLSYNLSGEIMDYSSNVRFTELFLNGEYEGLYLLTEKIEFNEDGRINLTETDPKLITTSYILTLDVGNQDPFYNLNTFNNYTGKNGLENRVDNRLEVVYPKKTLTPAQKKYIEDEVSQFEKALASFDSADRRLGYPSFIDVDSFVDYFIITEFTLNGDAGSLSTYFYKDIRGKMKVAVWDFNSVFNNYVDEIEDSEYFVLTDKVWYKQLIKDPYFVDKVIKRYTELRKTFLSDEYVLNYIDETIDYLGPAIERNNERWGYSFAKEHDLLVPERRNARNYEEAVKQLKDSVVERGAYLDENIETLHSLSHDSINKIFRERSGE